MANTTRATWDAYMFELQGTVHEAYAAEAPYLSEISGYGDTSPTARRRITKALDGNRDIFTGSQVRHTVDLNQMQSGGWPGEEGTWNVPTAVTSVKIYDKLCNFLQPFSVTIDVERDSMDHSNASAVTRLTMKAMQSCALNENLALFGDGTGLQATITDAATSLATTVTGANWDVLLPGTIWDVLTRSNGADPGQGLRRKIASVSITASTTGAPTAGTITWDTASQASDGGSGNIVHASTSGVYIPGSYSTPGTNDYLPNGLEEASATTGTFEGLSRTTYPQWAGTDGRQGDSSALMMSEAMLMGAGRAARRYGANSFDLGVGDPAAIDGYIQSFFAQRLFQPQAEVLKSGWNGIIVSTVGTKPFPLLGDMYCKKGTVYLVDKTEIQIYGDSKGPDFLQDDGAVFRRFSRALPKEAEMLDRMNVLYTNCSHIVKLGSLSGAA